MYVKVRRLLLVLVLVLAAWLMVGTTAIAHAGGQTCVSARVDAYGVGACGGFEWSWTRCWYVDTYVWPTVSVMVCHVMSP